MPTFQYREKLDTDGKLTQAIECHIAAGHTLVSTLRPVDPAQCLIKPILIATALYSRGCTFVDE